MEGVGSQSRQKHVSVIYMVMRTEILDTCLEEMAVCMVSDG